MASAQPRNHRGTEMWDQLYESLAAQPRRMIIFSLLKEPDAERLPLPDAATTANLGTDADRFATELRHHHLPALADAGYIRWEAEPFTVGRGPYFEEPALVVRRMTESGTEYPERLQEECVVLGEVTDDGAE